MLYDIMVNMPRPDCRRVSNQWLDSSRRKGYIGWNKVPMSGSGSLAPGGDSDVGDDVKPFYKE